MRKIFDSVLIGQKKALSYAVRNLTVSKRNTLLKERLCGRPAVQLKKQYEDKEGEN